MRLKQRNDRDLEKEFFAARPIRPELGVLGHKWALLVLADLGLRKIDRFGGLQRSNPKLNPRILSRRLRELEEAGMIRRVEKSRAPAPVRWALTEKGVDILPAIIRLISFGARWHAENPFHGKPPRKLS